MGVAGPAAQLGARRGTARCPPAGHRCGPRWRRPADGAFGGRRRGPRCGGRAAHRDRPTGRADAQAGDPEPACRPELGVDLRRRAPAVAGPGRGRRRRDLPAPLHTGLATDPAAGLPLGLHHRHGAAGGARSRRGRGLCRRRRQLGRVLLRGRARRHRHGSALLHRREHVPRRRRGRAQCTGAHLPPGARPRRRGRPRARDVVDGCTCRRGDLDEPAARAARAAADVHLAAQRSGQTARGGRVDRLQDRPAQRRCLGTTRRA